MLREMLPFWLSIAALSLLQGAVVAMPRAASPVARSTRGSPGVGAWLDRLGAGAWAVILPASIVVFVIVARAAAHASAQTLTYIALVAVPALAMLALGWLTGRARPAPALAAAVALFALAWADRGGLAGQGAAALLSGFSCAALGVVLARVTPARWLALGICAMAIADTAFVVSDLLRQPNSVLNAAHPAAGLPRLQSAAFGSAVMGYGDLFAAGVLGGLVARAAGRRVQLRAAALTALLAVCFDFLFFAVSELPATVPVALALVALSGELGLRGGGRASPLGARHRHVYGADFHASDVHAFDVDAPDADSPCQLGGTARLCLPERGGRGVDAFEVERGALARGPRRRHVDAVLAHAGGKLRQALHFGGR